MQKGYIYKITNLCNGKCYIGQTSKTIEERFREHKNDSKRVNTCEYPLYRAFKKYGIENFKLEKIEECDVSIINEREIYWISYYNSFNEGYNQTLGGGGIRTLQLDEQEIVNKYNELGNVNEVAECFGCSTNSIHEILLKNSVLITSAVDHAKEKGTIIERIDIKTGEILETYNTLHDAGQWVLDNKLSDAKNNKNCAIAIRYSIIKDSTVYGFRWNGEIENKESLKDRIEIVNKEWAQRNKEKIKLQDYDLCPICTKKKLKTSLVCKECENKKRQNKSLEDLNYKISKEDLMKLVREKSFLEIGRIYDVSDNTVKKWCKRYQIPFRKQDISSINEEDWEKECNLSKEEYIKKYIN